MTHKSIFLSYMIGIMFFSITSCQSIQTHQQYSIGSNTELIIEQGDITQSQCMVIVNAANKELAGGAGVCGAIFNAAGWNDLQSACDTYPMINAVRCPVGDAKITDSFNLHMYGISHIIHAVGPDCRIVKAEQEQDRLLKNAYTQSLLLADQYNLKSVAFPFISSAIYAFPKERACSIALKAVSDYVKIHDTHITSIHFVLFSQDDFQLFCDRAHESL